MINVHCYCENCKQEYAVEDVRMVYEQSKEYQERSEEEKIVCPGCGAEFNS